jgi:hypothetical protein
MQRTKIKLKGKQLQDMQTHATLIAYALEKALTDCFLRQEVFELLDSARDAAQDLERMLGL